jgi:uncharacterized protein (UPF0248 family)
MDTTLSQVPKIDYETAIRAVNFEPYFKFLHRQKCTQQAMSKPLPGESRGAFLNGAINIQGKSVHRIVPSDFIVLEALKSPILKMMEQATQSGEKKSEMEWTAQEEFEICYVFTTDPKEVYRTLKSKGVDEIKRLAEETILEWDAEIPRFVTLAVIEQLKRHVETKVKIATEIQKEGEISFFREQKS